MIQCFYDVVTVTGEPVRTRTLKLVEQLAQRCATLLLYRYDWRDPESVGIVGGRWKHTVMTEGWKKAEEPTVKELIDLVIGMYALERVGVHHDMKDELIAFCQPPPGSPPCRFCAGVKPSMHMADASCVFPALCLAVPFTSKDVLGWDPRTGPPPAALQVEYESETITKYRALSNALIHLFYADRVGVPICGCTYADVIKHLPSLRKRLTSSRLR
jgi:hypothetical protein